MIFELKQKKDKFLKEIYKNSMEELNDFYGINWVYDLPKIVVVNDRKTINVLKNRKTEEWLVGWIEARKVFILNRQKLETESNHKYEKKRYIALVKHELSHLFYYILIQKGYSPVWLSEGVAIYTSGQNKFKIRPKQFEQLLNFYDKHTDSNKKTVYYESGFFVEMLVKKFGKVKLLKFLKSLQKIKNKKEFDNLFFKTYKFKLNYREINKIG